MISIYSNRNQVVYGIQHFILDTVSDLEEMKKKQSLKPGSTLFIIETSKYYMLNGKKAWVEINPNSIGGSSNSGSGSGGSTGDEIYDGGSIDGTDPF